MEKNRRRQRATVSQTERSVSLSRLAMTNAGRSFSVWPAHAVLCTFLAGQHVCMLPLCTYSVLRSSAKALSTVCVKLEGHIIWKVTCQLPRSMSLPYTRNRTVQPANKKHCLRMEHLHTGEQLQTMEPLSWLELAAPAWHNVFAMLHPKDLSSLMMVSASDPSKRYHP